MNVTVIGSGVYGKSLGKVLLNSDANVKMWTEQEIKNVIVDSGIQVFNSYEQALKDAKLVYVLTGSKFVREVFNSIKEYIAEDTIIVLGSKGILSDGKLISDVAFEILPTKHIAAISGPTFAVDIAALEPVGFTLACQYREDFEIIKKSLKNVYLEYSDDIVGIELSGSLKNAYAIGSGILGGFNYGPSARCLYITRALHEMKEIFLALGASEKTITTLASCGDLVLTCTSLNSRNFTFGTIISLNDPEAKMNYLKNNTVEGYENLKVFRELILSKQINAPILKTVANIVLDGKESKTLIDSILNEN